MVGPREVIESYIADVAERLPLKGRADIACELHGLLSDDLCGRSKSACRPADETTARELVTDFGRPDSPQQTSTQVGNLHRGVPRSSPARAAGRDDGQSRGLGEHREQGP